MDVGAAQAFVQAAWDSSITPSLVDFVKIPNVSVGFKPYDAELTNKAIQHLVAWVKTSTLKGLTFEVLHLAECQTPLLFIEVPAFGGAAGNILLYGHADKQPPFSGWLDGLGPYEPVIKGTRLYGRGGADDGYAVYAALTALAAIQAQGQPHARAVVVIEASEESGSPDLPTYIKHLQPRIGDVDFVVCLDSGCGDYKRMWATTTLRGVCVSTLTVTLLTEGVHSGAASGVVPDTFRIARQLLDRIEDAKTGRVLVPELFVDVPEARRRQTEEVMAVLGSELSKAFPFIEGGQPVQADSILELALNRTWRPALSIVGASGLPESGVAGNVLRPMTQLKLSMRIPPRVNPAVATATMKAVLEKDPPYGARVVVEARPGAAGYDAPELAPWLDQASARASTAVFGEKPLYWGEGGSIPFMCMLGDLFPKAQFLITGVLGPQSNAHGPNEFIDLAYASRLTAVVSLVIADHAAAQKA